MSWNRRRIIWTGMAAGAAVLGGIGLGVRELSVKRYPPTPYDDLLVHLKDREAAASLGRQVLKSMPNLEPSAAVNALRARLSHESFAEAIANDLEGHRLIEANGWILPESFALLSALAARV